MRRVRIASLALAAGASALGAAPCLAGKATQAMPVSVQVVTSCSVSATPMAFSGVLAFLDRDATSTVQLNCSPNTAFRVDLDNGLNALGSNRRVRNLTSATFLDYEVYRDAARTSRWGANPASNVAGNSGPSGVATLTAYGRLQGGAGIFLGQYTDTLTVTVSF